MEASANTNLQPGAWNNRFFAAALTFLLSAVESEQPQANSFSIRVTSIKQSKKHPCRTFFSTIFIIMIIVWLTWFQQSQGLVGGGFSSIFGRP